MDKQVIFFGVCYYSGLMKLGRWWIQRSGQRLIILNYHRASGGDLRRHLLYLRRHYRMLHLEEALEELYTPSEERKREQVRHRRTPLVLTFDDGYHDNYTHAFPLACELRVPITIFLNPGYIENGKYFWWMEGDYLVRQAAVDRATVDGACYHLDQQEDRKALARAIFDRLCYAKSVAEREAFLEIVREVLAVSSAVLPGEGSALKWAEIRAMEASGWVSFGGHTMHHPVLGYLADPVEIEREVSECRSVMEQQLCHSVRTFAYPFGKAEHYGQEGLRAVGKAGYDWAVTTIYGFNTPRSDPRQLHRIVGDVKQHWLLLAADISGIRRLFSPLFPYGRAILSAGKEVATLLLKLLRPGYRRLKDISGKVQMKTVLQNRALAAKETATTRSSVKVCMHVLTSARTDNRVMRSAIALMKAGFDVCIVDVECEDGLPAEERIQGIRVKHIIMPGWYTSRRFKPWFLFQVVQMLILSTIRLALTSVDIYHAHDTSALPTSYIASLVRRKPLIFDAHELPLADEMKARQWRGLIRLFSHLLAIMVPRCAGLITVSSPIAREIHNRYHPSNVSVIRNILTYQTVPKSDRLRQHLGLSQAVRIALYQGGFHENRGLDKLVRAATFLEPNTVIVIMGEGAPDILTKLRSLIASEEVTERVKIIPAVPYAELLDWTASADLGLIVNQPDYSLNVLMCLPNKLFEYLMVGLPVLSSELEAVSEILSTYDVGKIVSPLTPTAIAEAINAMLADCEGLTRMHHNALQAARQLCWENEQQELIRLYRAILARRDKG